MLSAANGSDLLNQQQESLFWTTAGGHHTAALLHKHDALHEPTSPWVPRCCQETETYIIDFTVKGAAHQARLAEHDARQQGVRAAAPLLRDDAPQVLVQVQDQVQQPCSSAMSRSEVLHSFQDRAPG